MKRRTVLSMIAGLSASLFGRRSEAQVSAPDAQSPNMAKAEQRQAAMQAAFPYERVTVPGAEALATWERLRARASGWPVVIGGDEDFDRVTEQFSLDDSAIFPQHPNYVQPPLPDPAGIIAAAGKIKVPEALEALWRDEYGDEGHSPHLPEVGEWPASAEDSQPGLTVASDILKRTPHPRVHLVILPTSDSSEAPAYLRWGGWNACPAPEVHVAVLRDWKRRFGAELVGISGDVLNIRVTRRPTTRDEAMALAKEQYFYCSDIVDQGTGTLAPLAAALMESDWWFFWWD